MSTPTPERVPRLSAHGRRLIGDRVRELRGHRTQQVLADQAGISTGTLSAIERGCSDPTLGTMLRLSPPLELSSIEELIGPLQPPTWNPFPSTEVGEHS